MDLQVLVALLTEWFSAFWGNLGKLILAAVLGIFGIAGCAANSEPLERASQTIMSDVIKPVLQEAAADLNAQAAALQGQASLINPGYKIDGYGIVGTGFVWTATVRLDGVSGNIAGATSAVPATAPSP